MRRFVLDASAALAWYLPESFSASAREWQREMLSRAVRLVVPALHYWEVGNVLRTYVRRQEVDRATAEEVYQLHVDAPLEQAEPDRAIVLKTAFEFESTVYDAVYIALALAYDIRLITAERTTTPWVTRLGERAWVLR